jgi:hypothetical protein
MPDPIADARNLIQSRLAEIDAETRRLERAVASLGEGSGRGRRRGRSPKATAASPSPKPKRRAARQRKAARAARGERQAQLLEAIKANPSHGPAEHARTLGVASSQVHALLRKAQAEKLISKRGVGYALKS